MAPHSGLRPTMRSFIVFALVALVAAGFAPRYFDRVAHGGPAPAPAPAPAADAPVVAQPSVYSGGPRSVVIERHRNGHFMVEGAIDGRRVSFMVDTGASAISLTESDAGRLGYHPAPRDYVVVMQTANGTARAAPVKLDMVEVGDIMVRNVVALISPDRALVGGNLLGMTFLSRLHRFEYREGKLVLEE